MNSSCSSRAKWRLEHSIWFVHNFWFIVSNAIYIALRAAYRSRTDSPHPSSLCFFGFAEELIRAIRLKGNQFEKLTDTEKAFKNTRWIFDEDFPSKPRRYFQTSQYFHSTLYSFPSLRGLSIDTSKTCIRFIRTTIISLRNIYVDEEWKLKTQFEWNWK